MFETRLFMFLVFLSVLSSFSTADHKVTCVYGQSCTLTCGFQTGNDPIIHWIFMVKGDLHVHSYYLDEDHLEYQDQLYKDRTSLFRDQISRGNASLLLRGVKVQDQGRYRCYISIVEGSQEQFISLKVYAPVSEVHIHQVDNRMTCSSEGIYPEPELTWSTIPPSSWTLQNRTTVHQTEDQLYSISSSLVVSDGGSDLIYSCTIRTPRNWRRTRINKPASVKATETEATIFCSSSNISASSFIWRFKHSQRIVMKTEGSTSYTVTEEWRKHVKEVKESGSLTLQDLTSDQEGVYSCELSDEEETMRTDTLLRISQDQLNHGVFRSHIIIVVGVLFGAVLLVLVIVIIHKVRKATQNRNNGTEMEELSTAPNGESRPMVNNNKKLPRTHSRQKHEDFKLNEGKTRAPD